MKARQQLCVLSSGCDRGFGRTLVLRLAAKGVPIYAACYEQKVAMLTITLCDNGPLQNVESLLEESKNLKGKVRAFRMDVTDDKSCEEAGATVARLLGDKGNMSIVQLASINNDKHLGLWGIVANAGIIGPNAVDAWLTANDYIEHLQVFSRFKSLKIKQLPASGEHLWLNSYCAYFSSIDAKTRRRRKNSVDGLSDGDFRIAICWPILR